MAASVPFSFFLHVYQDRLGTNIGKAALKKRMMRLLTGGGGGEG
eukprot:COSAG06_NODE_70048_length_194_cov_24.652632_1_plen_43_part_10